MIGHLRFRDPRIAKYPSPSFRILSLYSASSKHAHLICVGVIGCRVWTNSASPTSTTSRPFYTYNPLTLTLLRMQRNGSPTLPPITSTNHPLLPRLLCAQMVDPGGISNHSVTYTKWEQKRWHPNTLQQHDVNPDFIRDTQVGPSSSTNQCSDRGKRRVS